MSACSNVQLHKKSCKKLLGNHSRKITRKSRSDLNKKMNQEIDNDRKKIRK